MDRVSCYHCGDGCFKHFIEFDEIFFCCHGCKTVKKYAAIAEEEVYVTIKE